MYKTTYLHTINLHQRFYLRYFLLTYLHPLTSPPIAVIILVITSITVTVTITITNTNTTPILTTRPPSPSSTTTVAFASRAALPPTSDYLPFMYPSAAIGVGSVYRRSTKALSASSFCAHRHRPSGPIGTEFWHPLAIG